MAVALSKHWDHFVFVEEDCIVGRKDSTLLIANDPSVSRKHAVLTLKHPEENLIKNEEYDLENLPRNLAIVKVVSLIVRKPVLSSEQQLINSGVKNFKRFKKVLPLKAQALPVIIGGHDLVPYDKNATKLAEQDRDDEPEVVHNGKVKGAFDWDSQNT